MLLFPSKTRAHSPMSHPPQCFTRWPSTNISFTACSFWSWAHRLEVPWRTEGGREMGHLGAGFEGMTTRSNLRSFLGSVTPIVATHTIAKRSSSSEKTTDGVKCFYLADLWNRFHEWSACGVGTPVRLRSGETIVQYFVPYLSAIQLYTNADFTPQRSHTWHSDRNVVCDNRFSEYNKKCCVPYNWIDQIGYGTTSPITKSANDNPSSYSNGELCFQYFEVDSPYERIPLADKVYELSYNFPALASLNSVELSPSSWMSVFWYPIGHVPMKNHKDLSTCFLTYHSLSTSEDCMPLGSEDAFPRCMALTPFGLATHKMEEVWISAESGDQELVAFLFGTAQSWLKKRDVGHHDFNYFLNNMNLTCNKSQTKE